MYKLLSKFNLLLISLSVLLLISSNSYAQTFSPAIKVLQNFNQTITTVKQGSTTPVLFPTRIPVKTATDKYYVNGSVFPNNTGYSINVDSTADCNGAKFCNIGSITATVGGKPQMHTSAPNGPVITTQVKLLNNQVGYFTPAHAEADYWPTMMEFQVNNVLYQVMWKIDPAHEKLAMMAIVNSMLKTGPY